MINRLSMKTIQGYGVNLFPSVTICKTESKKTQYQMSANRGLANRGLIYITFIQNLALCYI